MSHHQQNANCPACNQPGSPIDAGRFACNNARCRVEVFRGPMEQNTTVSKNPGYGMQM